MSNTQDFTVVDNRPSWTSSTNEAPSLIVPVDIDASDPQTTPKQYIPMNDRVLLKRVDEVDSLESKFIPGQFQTKSNKGFVVAVGPGMFVNGQRVAIDLKPGDVVLFGQYNSDSITIDGQKLLIVPAGDIRLKEVSL